MTDTIDPQLLMNSKEVADWTLNKVLFKNERHYPWFLLIPKADKKITELTQLSEQEQTQLMREINCLAEFMQTYFKTDKVNVASIGNQVPQLHVHVVGRYKNDPLWPESIWQAAYKAEHYPEAEYACVAKAISQQLLAAA